MQQSSPVSSVVADSRSFRQWTSGIAAVLFLASLVLPWESTPEHTSELFFSAQDIWKYGKLPALVLGVVMLSLLVWNRPRHWAVRLVIAAVLVFGALAALWLFWNATQNFWFHGPQFHAGIGFYVYGAGLGVTAVAGIAQVFPERRTD